jgi:hypothetical protein
MRNKETTLRFGVMCSGTTFSEYAARAIRKLRKPDGVELALLIVDERAHKEHTVSNKRQAIWNKVSSVQEMYEQNGIRRTINQLSWYGYNRIQQTASCNREIDLIADLDSVPKLYCDVREDGYSEYFYKDDVEKIEQYDLDFILRRGFGIIRGEILDIPEYGVWSYHHDDERKYRGSPPCFWEIYNQDPVTGAVLQRLTDRLDGGIILRRGFLPTERSHKGNMNQVKFCSAQWPAQVATDIQNGCADYINAPPTETDAHIYTKPTLGQLVRYQVRKFQSLVKGLLRGNEKWTIGILDTSIEQFVDDNSTEPIEWYAELQPGRFLADPFGIELNGQQYIFAEEYCRSARKGWISYLEVGDEYISGPEPAFKPDFHTSYPYLIKIGGDVYCIPETKAVGEIRLYRVDSPTNWCHEETLVPDVAASDPTVIHYQGRWWMFFTQEQEHWPGHNTDLYIWSAPRLRGPWEPHTNNPVKTDVRSARPAGTPFFVDNELYRPAQNCSREYGQKITINRVKALTTTSFAETTAFEIEPTVGDSYPRGRHTISSFGDVSLIDGKRHTWDRHTVVSKCRQIWDILSG